MGRGVGGAESDRLDHASQVHGAARVGSGLALAAVVAEYRALRASVVKQWVAHHKTLASTDLGDLTRFNEAIDQAVTESVAHYTKTINNSRNLFLGILGHDLRNPISAIASPPTSRCCARRRGSFMRSSCRQASTMRTKCIA